jgi:nicotinamidase-related amidase
LYIEMFRSHNCPVIRIYHFSKGNGPEVGSKDFEFPDSVLISTEDVRVIKTYPDAFNKTDLEKIIREKECNSLFLCGLSAVGCVLATLIGAINHDYKAFMVKDAIMSHNKSYTDNIEKMFDAVGYEMIKLILEHSE